MGNLAGDRKTHSIKKDLEGIEPSRLSGVPIFEPIKKPRNGVMLFSQGNCRSELARDGLKSAAFSQ
jgi:hypothetical protein